MSAGSVKRNILTAAKGSTVAVEPTGTDGGTDRNMLDVTVRAADGSTPTIEVAGSYATGLDPTDAGVTVNARAHQNWPASGRNGVTGDNQFYSQNMNDLGDLLVSLGSITSLAGSTQIDCDSGNAGAGTLRVVIADDQPVVPITDAGGSLTVDGTVSLSTASTATLTNLTASASSQQVLALNTNRKMATFFNDSTANCYLKLGTTASTTSFTVKLTTGAYYELPQPCYTGRIDAIWDSATGDLRITEIT